MSRKLSLRRSVSFTDADPVTPYSTFPVSQFMTVTMAHPANIVSNVNPLSQRRRFHPHRSSTATTGSVTFLTCLALMSEVFALVPLIVAYVAPYWMQASDSMGLTYSGLWRLCAFTYCEYFIGHPMHTWFHTVQVCLTLALVCHFFSFIATCVHAFSPGCLKCKPHLIWAAATSLIIADVFQLSSVVLYGIYQGAADPGTLSWAYVLATLCTGFTLLPIVFLILEALRILRKRPRKNTVLHRSVSEASIVSKEIIQTDIEAPNPSTKEIQNRPTQIRRDRTHTLVRMRVNSCSALLSESGDIPAGFQESGVLDNSVFD